MLCERLCFVSKNESLTNIWAFELISVKKPEKRIFNVDFLPFVLRPMKLVSTLF